MCHHAAAPARYMVPKRFQELVREHGPLLCAREQQRLLRDEEVIAGHGLPDRTLS